MTSYFPDVNIWLALSIKHHVHNAAATAWLSRVRFEDRVIFSRFTQLGLLRLITKPGLSSPACDFFSRFPNDSAAVVDALSTPA